MIWLGARFIEVSGVACVNDKRAAAELTARYGAIFGDHVHHQRCAFG